MAYPYNGIIFGNKRNKVLTGATTWMKVESITQNKRSQAQVDNYCMAPLNGLARTGNSVDGWLPRAGEGEKVEVVCGVTVSGYRVSFGGVTECSKISL